MGAAGTRVFVDGLAVVDPHVSGVGQYVLGLLRGMDELLGQARAQGRPAPRVEVVVTRDTVQAFADLGLTHLGCRALPLSLRWANRLWRRGLLPPIDLWLGRGSYLFPRFATMPLLRSRCAVVVYDLAFALHPEFVDEPNAAFLARAVPRSVRRAGRVVTISQSTRADLVRVYGLDPDMVVVAPPAADPRELRRREAAEIARVTASYGVVGDYVLSLANLEPRKNLEALVEAYCALPEDLREQVVLLLVGVDGWKDQALQALLAERVAQGHRIVRPSRRVSDADRAAVFSGARVLVYPSHYEGFGMPPLEALACGTPVITSDNSSLPEVVGDAGVMVDSRDTLALTAALRACLQNWPAVSARAQIQGPAQAARFSWQASAQTVLDVLAGPSERN